IHDDPALDAKLRGELARMLSALAGEHEEAEAMLRATLAIQEETWREDVLSYPAALETLAQICERRRDFAEAQRIWARLGEVLREVRGEDDASVAGSEIRLAECLYRRWDDTPEAERGALVASAAEHADRGLDLLRGSRDGEPSALEYGELERHAGFLL